MTSELQRAANRHNAKKSSGPKTVLGKTRAGANSRKHGLAAKRVYDAAEQEEIASLVDRILTSTNELISLSQAISIAAAQLDLQKVRSIETAYLETMCGANLAGSNPITRAKALHGLVAIRSVTAHVKSGVVDLEPAVEPRRRAVQRIENQRADECAGVIALGAQ